MRRMLRVERGSRFKAAFNFAAFPTEPQAEATRASGIGNTIARQQQLSVRAVEGLK